MIGEIGARIQSAGRATAAGLREFAGRIRQMVEDSAFVGDHLISHGWPPRSLLEGPDAEAFATALRECEPAEIGNCIDAAMLQHYTPDRLDALYKSWSGNETIARRLPIMRQVVDAHKDGLFFLTVPVVFAQVEGIIAEAFNINGKFRGKKFDRLMALVIKGAFDFRGNEAARRFWEETVRAEFEHGNPVQSDLSRHAIVHGGDTNYGTETRSLKGILFFDFVEIGLRDALVVAEAVAHRPGCHEINGRSDSLDFIRHRVTAQFAGVAFGAFCDTCRPQDWPHKSGSTALLTETP